VTRTETVNTDGTRSLLKTVTAVPTIHKRKMIMSYCHIVTRLRTTFKNKYAAIKVIQTLHKPLKQKQVLWLRTQYGNGDVCLFLFVFREILKAFFLLQNRL
jgi:hypothetical protein